MVLSRDLPWAQRSEVAREHFNVIKGWKGVGWDDMTQGGKGKIAIEPLGEWKKTDKIQLHITKSTNKTYYANGYVCLCVYTCVKVREAAPKLSKFWLLM